MEYSSTAGWCVLCRTLFLTRSGGGSGLRCVWKVFTVLHCFHIFLCCSLIPKWFKIHFSLKILHTAPIMKMWKVFSDVCKLIKNKNKNLKRSHIRKYCSGVSWFHWSDDLETWLDSTNGKFRWLDMIWRCVSEELSVEPPRQEDCLEAQRENVVLLWRS